MSAVYPARSPIKVPKGNAALAQVGALKYFNENRV
jgi:hypothetical protein